MRDQRYAIVILIFTIGLLVSFNVWYVNHEQAQADQRWCDLFVGLDDNYRAAPVGALPERTLTFARQIRALRKDLHCRDTIVPLPTPPSVSPSNR